MASTTNIKAERESCEEGGNSRKTDTEDDLCLLLDCLRFQQHCVSAQKQALTTIATMCSNSNSSRNLFNSTGGLSYVLDLLFSSKSLEVQQAALYTLGCATESNLVNQLKLCNEHLFSFLTELLVTHSDKTTSNSQVGTLIISVAFLGGCLMSNNVQGQKIARESGLISKLTTVFRATLPSSLCLTKQPTDGASAISTKPTTATTQHQHRLWSSVCSALCTATNNPQNETNQCQCIKLFPAALSVFGLTPSDPSVMRPAVSLLASCVANNKAAQDRLRMVGGLKTLVNTLRTVVQSLSSMEQLSELPLHIIKTLSAAAFGHSINCETLVDLDCVDLLLCLLQYPELDLSTKLNAILCLGMLTEDSCTAQQKLAEKEGICLLVEVMANSQSEELQKAATFVLHCCVYQKKHQGQHLPEEAVHNEETVLNEKITHIDKLLLPHSDDMKESPINSVSGRSISKEALDILDTKKLPMKELVSIWLENNPPADNSELGSSKTSIESSGIKAKEATSTPLSKQKISHEPASVPKTGCTVEETDSQTLVELQQEKKLREKLQAMLKVEREKREQLEQELSEKKKETTHQELVTATTSTNTEQGELKQAACSSSHTPINSRKGVNPLSASASGRANVRYANSAKAHTNGIQRLCNETKAHNRSIQPKPPNTCINDHSLVNLLHKHGENKQVVCGKKHKTVDDKQLKWSENGVVANHNTLEVQLTIPKEVVTKRQHAKNSKPSKRIPHQLHLSTQVGVIAPHSESGRSYPYSEFSCDHQCLGCKPRLKCPLITSRNFIKFLRVDHYTCSYHRRLASKFRRDIPPSRPLQHQCPALSGTCESTTVQTTDQISDSSCTPLYSLPDLEVPETTTSVTSPSNGGTTATSDSSQPDVHCNSLGPTRSSDCLPPRSTTSSDSIPSSSEPSSDDSPSDDPDYTPSTCSSSNTSSSASSCKITYCASRTQPKPHTPCDAVSSQHGAAYSARMYRPLVPTVYKLVPGTCGPSSRATKMYHLPKPSSRPLGEITNKDRRRPPDSSETSDQSLAVFDYATPEGKSKYLPQRSIEVIQYGTKKSASCRQKPVPWTKQEENFLREGVQLLGVGQWRHILAAYSFHINRDSESLRLKYRNMCNQKK